MTGRRVSKHGHDSSPDPSASDADILVVEDNPGDVRLLQEAMAAAGLTHHLHVVSTGAAALEFVHRRNEFANVPQPDLILLDLNLPQINGHEVLTELKADPTNRCCTPIIVLSSSHEEEDIRRAYAAGANAYLTKPITLSEIIEQVRTIETFWLSSAQLPE